MIPVRANALHKREYRRRFQTPARLFGLIQTDDGRIEVFKCAAIKVYDDLLLGDPRHIARRAFVVRRWPFANYHLRRHLYADFHEKRWSD